MAVGAEAEIGAEIGVVIEAGVIGEIGVVIGVYVRVRIDETKMVGVLTMLRF